jgi:hypothetical protein
MAYKAEDLKSAQDEAKKAVTTVAELRGQLRAKNELIAYLKASMSPENKTIEADLLNAPAVERAEPLVFSETDDSAVSASTSAIEACPVAVPTVKAKKKIKR